MGISVDTLLSRLWCTFSRIRVMPTLFGDALGGVLRGGPEKLMPTPLSADAGIFLVDDDARNLQLMDRILAGAGYETVRKFNDPRLALEVLVHSCPDLILLDLDMPDLDSSRFMELLHSQTSPSDFVPVIVLTSDTSRSALWAALEAGASEFVTKPIADAELLLRVRNLVSIRYCHQELKNTNVALANELRARTRLDDQRASERTHQAHTIRRIIERGGPAMVFQPIVELSTGRTVGVEALARFGTEPQRGPDQWFADAALVGLGAELELSAIEAALRHLPDIDPSYVVAVNISPATMFTREFTALTEALPLDRMSFEVTEHQPIDDYERLRDVAADLRSRGALMVVDDAGAGFASLRHILKLEPDVIKLDITLTRDIDRDPVKRALASSLTTFAGDIGAAITAEGIETHAELLALRALGIDYGQGFFLAQPASARAGLPDGRRGAGRHIGLNGSHPPDSVAVGREAVPRLAGDAEPFQAVGPDRVAAEHERALSCAHARCGEQVVRHLARVGERASEW